jgi:hypothetical protein
MSELRSQAEADSPGLLRGLQNIALGITEGLPWWLKAPIAHGVGRVVTNNYSGNTVYGTNPSMERLKHLEAWKNAWNDTPAKFLTKQYGEMNDNEITLPLFRQYFDLPYKDPNQVFLKDGNNFKYNEAAHPVKFNDPVARVIFGMRQARQDKENWLNKFSPDLRKYVEQTDPWVASNLINGQYIPGQPDRWDFDLHANERPAPTQPYSSNNFVREWLEKLTGERNAAVVNTNY